MRLSVLLAVALLLMALGVYLIGVGTIRSRLGSPESVSGDERIETYIRRDERGRPVCRRGVIGEDPNRIVEIGHNCP